MCSKIIFVISALGIGVFEVENPVVFTYEEIFSATDGFSDSNLIGHGIYGSVFYGFLRDQVCNPILACNLYKEIKACFSSPSLFYFGPFRMLLSRE